MGDRGQQQSYSHKRTYLFWSIIVLTAILDSSLANLGNLISTNISGWKIQLYLLVSIIFIAGQFYILDFIKRRNPARKGKTRLSFQTLFKIVSGVQYTLIVTLIITIMQILVASYYSV